MFARIPRPLCAALVLVGLALACGVTAQAGVVVRVRLEPGVMAAIKDGRLVRLECRPPRGDASKALLQKYLAHPEEWTRYRDRVAVAIPFDQLSDEAQRQVLLTIFEQDVVNEEGWWHTVTFSGLAGQETLWMVCEWLTGKGTHFKAVSSDHRNGLSGDALKRGQRILVPAGLLRPGMRAPTPDRFHLLEAPIEESDPLPPEEPDTGPATENGLLNDLAVDPEAVGRELEYGTDRQGAYAQYRLKKAEALFTAVVVRFTDFRENEEILKACEVVRKRSGIKDVRRMKPGQPVRIPLEMLSDRYHPEGSERRRQYEAALEEAARLKKERVTTRDLNGVVVVLDPGHGGRDHGAPNARLGLYEDELNYDIVCRIRRILESRTDAKVHVLLRDLSQGDEPVDVKRFVHDTDEVLLTTPNYENGNARVSANLRWYLANALYRDALRAGADSRKVVFTSIHCDAIFNEKLRGAMVYIPGAKHRGDGEERSGKSYDRYKEVREQRRVRITDQERRHDEAVSRNFAEALLEALGRHNPPIKRHSASDPIRSQIRRGRGKPFVPAVLRNTKIPTKVLVETANLTNPTDCKRLADPEWREWFAEAYVDALKTYYGS